MTTGAFAAAAWEGGTCVLSALFFGFLYMVGELIINEGLDVRYLCCELLLWASVCVHQVLAQHRFRMFFKRRHGKTHALAGLLQLGLLTMSFCEAFFLPARAWQQLVRAANECATAL